MKKVKIVADNGIPYLKGILDPVADIEYQPHHQINRAVLRDADGIIIRTRTRCNDELLQGTAVKFIATATIGFDHIDTGFCRENGISWQASPGCNADSVIQYLLSAFACLYRERSIAPSGKNLGIIGVGNIGSRLQKAATALGFHTLLNDPPRESLEGSTNFVSLDYLLRHSDIISVHVPLTHQGNYRTRHLFDQQHLSIVKKDSIFINTSRGEVIDTEAFLQVLKTGSISEYVMDVWENEPHPDQNLVEQAFLATPHIAGYSADGKLNATHSVVNAVCRFFGLEVPEMPAGCLPQPGNALIEMDATGRSFYEVVTSAILSTYDVRRDDFPLRTDQSQFEALRTNYPPRREFKAYSILLKNGSSEMTDFLSLLGFKVHTS